MVLPKIEKQIRQGLPQVGVKPYGQIHAHSTGNRSSTAQNEADYHMRRPVESGFFSHVVGNGRVIQTAPVNRGAYDVGGGWNAWGYAHVELIESHKTKEEFLIDYKIYVELLRTLAKEAGIPIKVDSGNTGILSHEYCTYHQPNNHSDHVDPYPYLAKWGISRAQFKKDVEGGLSEVAKPATTTKSKFKIGDKVRVKIALYKDSQGNGRSTKSVGKIGTIKRDVGKGKRYLIDSLGWAHENDIELVANNTYPARKVGDTVTVQSFATNYQTGQKISNFVKGRKYKIKQVKNVNQSKSKRAYLLDGINSWVLEQDVK